jgi:uncharacterized membrane protein YqaE (UPF0057 family)
MGLFRALLCILLPPLAVLDKGCGSFLLVLILTLCGWVPGALAALLICLFDRRDYIVIRSASAGRHGRGDAIDIEAREL